MLVILNRNHHHSSKHNKGEWGPTVRVAGPGRWSTSLLVGNAFDKELRPVGLVEEFRALQAEDLC